MYCNIKSRPLTENLIKSNKNLKLESSKSLCYGQTIDFNVTSYQNTD